MHDGSMPWAIPELGDASPYRARGPFQAPVVYHKIRPGAMKSDNPGRHEHSHAPRPASKATAGPAGVGVEILAALARIPVAVYN